ncbi:tyrosine-protein phosphatase [Paucilactobacillus suebicus]|uniref:Protein tyrosine serine phosphatase n=1 Tax=Paucilactobacillus suebicus DSM 5007 = KCTC 3549 TaxID=1423807 RepID=A0A0R1W2H4_9LACO|nr:tyrosine-protein phosphatase [Paucilactobacillus suebicus]KRM11765.1 protein tyrosine serine phosphatase [Paucilactobacillus suebicus DSM 5007 = KCTC 3549]
MTTNRLLPIKHGRNFRDLGGYQTKDGKTIKWHRLIRSGHLNTLDETDLQVLTSLNVKLDLDFRAPGESDVQPDKVPATAVYHSLPVFQTDRTDASHSREQIEAEFSDDPTAGYRHMLDVYRDMVTTPQAKQSYQQFFDLLLNSDPNSAILFHCTAGKDRTGMGAILLLSALNVDRQISVNDYLLTNQINQQMLEDVTSKIRAAGKAEAYAQNTKALMSVSPDYINNALKIIDKEYGSIRNYLNQYLQITDQNMKDLQKLFTE